MHGVGIGACPVGMRASNLVHLGRDAVEEGEAIVPFRVEVKVRFSWQECELRAGSEIVQRRLQAVRRTIEIERVVGTDDEMNLALQRWPNLFAIQVHGLVGSTAGSGQGSCALEVPVRFVSYSQRSPRLSVSRG